MTDAPLYSRGGCVRSSGYITYDELHEVVRRKMHVKPKTMSDHDLRGLWCALDVDQSNTLLMDEFGKFLKLGAVSAKLKKQPSKGIHSHQSSHQNNHQSSRGDGLAAGSSQMGVVGQAQSLSGLAAAYAIPSHGSSHGGSSHLGDSSSHFG